MGALKEALYSDMAKDFVGEVICVDLGVSFKRYTQGFKADIYLLEESDFVLPNRDFLPPYSQRDIWTLSCNYGRERWGRGALCLFCFAFWCWACECGRRDSFCSVPSSIMHGI